MTNTVVVSLSGGKDSTAMLLHLVEHYGPDRLIAHYQVLPEDWPESLPYVQQVCARLGVRLVAQQMVYEPAGEGTGVRRLEVVDVETPGDIVSWGQPGVVAGLTDLALRRKWPPTPGCRFGTAYYKVRLLDWWIVQQQQSLALGEDVLVALGERWAESPRRAKRLELWPRPRCGRKTYRVWNWLPMLAWSRRQTFRRLRDWGIAPHPAYRAQGLTPWQMYDLDVEGGPRTGCRACIYATHTDLCHQALSDANRGLFERIRFVEQATGRTWWIDGRTAGQYLDAHLSAPARPVHYQPALLAEAAPSHPMQGAV